MTAERKKVACFGEFCYLNSSVIITVMFMSSSRNKFTLYTALHDGREKKSGMFRGILLSKQFGYYYGNVYEFLEE